MYQLQTIVYEHLQIAPVTQENVDKIRELVEFCRTLWWTGLYELNLGEYYTPYFNIHDN